MNKQDIISSVAKDLGLSRADAEKTVRVVLDTMLNGAADPENTAGYTVFHGHKFKLLRRGERQGRNPLTGERITIPAKKFVVYKREV